MSTRPETHARVCILDAAEATRDQNQHILAEAGWRTETYASVDAFLRRLPELVPCCLLMHSVLDGTCGLELQRSLAQSCPHLSIVFLAACPDLAAGIRAMKAGAVDFLPMPADAQALLSAVGEAIARSANALDGAKRIRVLRENHASLTGREREVMGLVTSGLLNKQAACELGISEITVKAHRAQVMRKMNARSFADLVSFALDLGIKTAAPLQRNPALPGPHLRSMEDAARSTERRSSTNAATHRTFAGELERLVSSRAPWMAAER